ncbi:MAG: hypothetical protein RMK18_04535 [Armatimonadota bacterium]|nr:hypothetical protein [Armatimonadota bacterium]MCX7778349.1 hypothetical protein [Armatimonadota bacterium]MDW8025117.1 hypothetical protein [Armatimonadota bacterium]
MSLLGHGQDAHAAANEGCASCVEVCASMLVATSHPMSNCPWLPLGGEL